MMTCAMMTGAMMTCAMMRFPCGPKSWGQSCLIFGSAAAILMLTFGGQKGFGQDDDAKTSPSLGVTKMIEQIVLPGTLLTHKKVDPTTSPLMVRVVRSFPHGDSFRYDISYFGMDAGEYDLREFLVREDGSSIDALPPIPVTIKTILEEGHIEPNQLEVGALSKYGGYWQLLIVGAVVWVGILLGMIFVGRKKKKQEIISVERKSTLAELLKPSVEKAIAGTLPKEKHAELERMLFAFWQRKLSLDDLEPAKALNRIRNDDQSGPLIREIEAWLHSPPGANATVNVAELLDPYQKYDAAEFDDQNDEANEKGDSA